MPDNKPLSKDNSEKATKKKSGRLKNFFKGVWSELKKVHWPTKKQLVSYTGVVIVTVVVMALAISVFDWVISTVFNWLLGLSA